MIKTVRTIEDVLPERLFQHLWLNINCRPRKKDETLIRDGGIAGMNIYMGHLKDPMFSAIEAMEEHLPELSGEPIKDVVIRYDGAEPALRSRELHHDLSYGADRKLSLILYFDSPEKGGELVFPFYEWDGAKADNIVSQECSSPVNPDDPLLPRSTCHDEDLKKYIDDDKDNLFKIKPKKNMAVIIDNTDKTLWHMTCPIDKEAKKTCVVFIW